jgi:hypothetical protein
MPVCIEPPMPPIPTMMPKAIGSVGKSLPRKAKNDADQNTRKVQNSD